MIVLSAGIFQAFLCLSIYLPPGRRLRARIVAKFPVVPILSTMLGNFQQSHLRIELSATAQSIGQQLGFPDGLKRLLAPGKISLEGNEPLRLGDRFSVKFGWVSLEQQVADRGDRSLRFLLHGGIDGYQEWCWGDGWVQSCWEGISVLPLSTLQTWQLLKLQQVLTF
jgi:hypothetical protein